MESITIEKDKKGNYKLVNMKLRKTFIEAVYKLMQNGMFDMTIADEKGKDVTSFFNDGAYKALQVAQFKNVAFVILKEGSPSCGSNFVYDGTFSGKKIPGQGVTAKLLKKSGIHIYSENDIPDLIFKLENNKN